MTLRIAIGQGQLGQFQKKLGPELRAARLRALHAVGKAGVRMLAFATKDVKDLGSYGAGWRYKAAFTKLYFFNATRHALFVEKGRRAGAAMPPLAPIRAWALRHGLPAKAAWPIAKRIAERGIRARPALLRPDIQKSLRQVYGAAMLGAMGEAARKAAGK